MAHKNTIAIVGRPNVGKSALFNRICKKRIAIVEDIEGVTRDRLHADAECFGRPFQIVDTGGIQFGANEPFSEQVRQQAFIAIQEADALLFVVDAQAGPTELDLEIASILRKSTKPVCLAINKVDNEPSDDLAQQFSCLGIPSRVCVSALQGLNIAELLESVLQNVPAVESPEDTDPDLSIAIIGRANVGKSTFINNLLASNRCIASPLAGTTRDSVDIPVSWEGQKITLIDTAGIRRKKSERDVVEKFAFMRTERSIERSDVCILMLDAQEGLTTQEKRIASLIEKAGRGCVIVFNKWDAIQGYRMEHCLQALRQQAPFLAHCPALFISSLTGRGVKTVMEEAIKVGQNLRQKIPTPELNKFVEQAISKHAPPMIGGKRLRIYYMVQIATSPPKFLLFVNWPNLMHDSLMKFLYRFFRQTFSYKGVPLFFHMRGKEQKSSL